MGTVYRTRTHVHSRCTLAGAIAVIAMAALFLAGCSDVRPVAKIGLIAPFEGLHRRSGYEALTAMRQAIADAPPSAIGFIPLALDDSADPERTRRAVEKLLVDPQVKAVIGPLTPALAAASADLFRNRGVPWLTPFAVAPDGGFAAPLADEEWAIGLAKAAGVAVREQGAATLVIAGERQGWPAWSDAEWSEIAGLPTRFLTDNPSAIESLTTRDAIFWLGSAEAAVAFLNELPTPYAQLPFWIGTAGGDPILTERLKIDRKLYWLAWSNPQYTEWAANREPSTPSAFLVYQATRAAIDAVTGAATTVITPWHVERFEMEGGFSRPYAP